MKYTLFLIAAANLAVTQPITESAFELVGRNPVSLSELAAFDDLTSNPVPALNLVPVPYHNLNFSSFGFQAAGTDGIAAGVVPESAPNYAANGPLSPTRTPMFTTQGTNATSFDLETFDYGCLVATETENAHASTDCTFTVTGFKASNGAKVGPTSFQFSPNSLTSATMMEATFGGAYSGLKEVTLALTSSPATVALTVLLVDSVKYVVHLK